MRKVPGIYVPVRGDYSQLSKDMGKARDIVTEQARGISNALNNALSPDQVKRNLNAIIANLNGLSKASQVIGGNFTNIGVDLKHLGHLTGITEKEFANLQQRMLRTQAEKAQEKALRDIAKAANLTGKEIRSLGLQMNVSQASVSKITKEMDVLGSSGGMNAAKWREMVVSIGLYTVAMGALYGTVSGIKNEFVRGLKAVEDFDMSIVETTALITTFSERAKTGDVAGAYVEANAYAEKLVRTLEMIDTRTIANSQDLRAMSQAFIENGVQVEVSNKKQLDGFTAVANALAVLTKGQNREIQMRQEIKGLMDGEIRASDRLGTMLKAMVPDLEKQLRIWREQGTTLEELGKLLAGFDIATKDLENQWSTVGSTMETIHDRILRGMFEPVFKDLIKLAKEFNKQLMDVDGNLTPLARGMIKAVNEAYELMTSSAKNASSNLFDPVSISIRGAGAAVDFLKSKLEDLGSTPLEQAKNDLAEIEQKIKDFTSRGDDWWEFSFFKDKNADKEYLDGLTAQAERLRGIIGDIQNEGIREKQRATGAGLLAPTLVKPPAEQNKSLASDYNAALAAKLDYLKASEEKRLAIVKAANALEQQANQNAYDLGLISYQEYLDSKYRLTEDDLQKDLEAKQKALAEAKQALAEIKPITDKEGKARPDKDEKNRYDALKRVEQAEKEALESANRLRQAQVEGAHEAASANAESLLSYQALNIQLLEMRGQHEEAAMARAQYDQQSVEYRRLEAAALNGEVAAIKELTAIEAIRAHRNQESALEREATAKESEISLARLNGEYQRELELKAELLDVEIRLATLRGESPQQIAYLKATRAEIEEMTTAAGAFAVEWRRMSTEWANETKRMQDLARGTAEAMHGSFEDLFFDALQGDMKSFMDYFKSFLTSLNRALAKFWADWLMSSMTGSSSSGGGLSWLVGLFGAGSGTGTASVPVDGWHSGGTVGVDSPTFSRNVHADVFDAAPRYHKGMMSDEYPAILQRGESVLTKGQMESIGKGLGRYSGGGDSITINVPVTAEGKGKRWSTDLKHEIEDTVDRYMRRALA